MDGQLSLGRADGNAQEMPLSRYIGSWGRCDQHGAFARANHSQWLV